MANKGMIVLFEQSHRYTLKLSDLQIRDNTFEIGLVLKKTREWF